MYAMKSLKISDKVFIFIFSLICVFQINAQSKKPEYTRDGRFLQSGRVLMPGDANSWFTYCEEWANVSNTPFRSYKQYTHDGGIASPMILHWPKGITAKGQLRNQPSHLIEVIATCLAIKGLEYPKQFIENAIQTLEGKSLLIAFTNKPHAGDFIFWEHSANRAIIVGNRKLVSKTEKQKTFGASDENKLKLYNLENDSTERINLVSEFFEKTNELA